MTVLVNKKINRDDLRLQITTYTNFKRNLRKKLFPIFSDFSIEVGPVRGGQKFFFEFWISGGGNRVWGSKRVLKPNYSHLDHLTLGEQGGGQRLAVLRSMYDCNPVERC